MNHDVESNTVNLVQRPVAFTSSGFEIAAVSVGSQNLDNQTPPTINRMYDTVNDVRSPEVKSLCSGSVGAAGVQASEEVSRVTVIVAFVQVTDPVDHDTNTASLEKEIVSYPDELLAFDFTAYCVTCYQFPTVFGL